MDSGRQKNLLNDKLRKFEYEIGELELLINHLETRIIIRGPYENLKILKRTLTYERKRLENITELYLKELRSPTIC